MSDAAPRPLPPRPRRREWAVAGLAAGLLLGVFEAALGLLEGAILAPGLLLALVTASALLVAVPSALAGLHGRARGLSLSALVGAVAGAVVAAPPLGAVLGTLLGPGWPFRALLGALPGLAVAGGVGFAAAWMAERLEERHGLPTPPLPVWGLVAFLVAAAERRLATGSTLLDLVTVVAAALILAGLGSYALASVRVRVGPLGRIVLLAALAAGGLAWGPRVAPWIWYEPDLRAPLPETPSLLAVWLPASPDRYARRLASVSLLEASGVRVDVAATLGDPTPHTIFRLPDGASVFAALHARGARSAAIVADPHLAPPAGVRDVRFPGEAQERIRREAGRTAGGPLLAALDARDWIGLDPDLAEVTGAAIRWLLAWRAAPELVPFALVVDYRTASRTLPDDEALDREVGRLLDFVEEIGAGPSSQIVVTEPGEGRLLGVTWRPPPVAPGDTTRSLAEARRVAPQTVATVLLRTARSRLHTTRPAPAVRIP